MKPKKDKLLQVPMKARDWAELHELQELMNTRSMSQTVRTALSRCLMVERLRAARDRQLLEEATGEA